MRSANKQTKTAQLERLLLDEIESRQLKPHDRFLSEHEIVEKYSINQMTVRQTLGRLSANGVIYRRHGQGTFISPKPRNTLILIVTDNPKISQGSARSATFYFMMGFQTSTQCETAGFYPLIISKDEYLKHHTDILLIHRNLGGIIFYSNPDPYIETYQFLLKNNIPALYYGSDLNINNTLKINCVVYPQERIVDIALSHLNNNNHQKIGFIGENNRPQRIQRLELFKKWMQKIGKTEQDSIIIDLSKLDHPNDLDQHIYSAFKEQQITGWLCADDTIGQRSINAAYRSGLRIPQDIAIVSINNYALCDRLICPLTSVEIPFIEDAETCAEIMHQLIHSRPSNPIRKISNVRLITRESSQKILPNTYANSKSKCNCQLVNQFNDLPLNT